MILGVMSDTHGNRRLMHRVADLMTGQLNVELIFHLGDDYTDGEELQLSGHEVRIVPGLWCEDYKSGRVAKCLVEEIDGLTIVCAHADADVIIPPDGAAIILTGHTHRACIELVGRSLHVDPGHLRGPRDRKQPPSFATVNIGAEDVRASIHELAGAIRLEKTVSRAHLA